jgi:hypothetical protein
MRAASILYVVFFVDEISRGSCIYDGYAKEG